MYYEIFGWAKGVGFKEVMKKKIKYLCHQEENNLLYFFTH